MPLLQNWLRQTEIADMDNNTLLDVPTSTVEPLIDIDPINQTDDQNVVTAQSQSFASSEKKQSNSEILNFDPFSSFESQNPDSTEITDAFADFENCKRLLQFMEKEIQT